MKVNIISIGNSKGIRIPRAILEQCNLNDEARIEVKNNVLFIKPVKKKPRKGWEKALSLTRSGRLIKRGLSKESVQ